MSDIIRIIVLGRVQGVGYRKFALARAKELGVLGSVQNLQDGSVEVYAKASKEVMERFIAMLKEGPSRASVEDLRISVCEVDSGDLDSGARDNAESKAGCKAESKNAESRDLDSSTTPKAPASKTQAPKAPAHIDFTDFIILP